MVETTESFLRIEAIFYEAFAAPGEARAELIETRCGGDRELAAEVRLLLEASEAEERLAASRRLEPGAGRESQAEARQIGPYLLDRLLGRGGMGAVYLAHRADGQFEQKVAIKLIDLPFATGVFQKRFRQERQILAGLQHPYIARLLDGGVTAAGDLYLVMEYVDGVPIHRFCQEHRLSEHERLELFLHVCEAVQFAHQNFVVHRDLKPDNIMVAEDGTPRLLDFGTAKLLSPSEAAPGSELTREGYQSYTPQYASPEQVLGNPITTASDTYSLGVLLYLLLTGEPPYEFKELTTGEMLRVVCEEAPRKPSQEAVSGKRLNPDLVAILEKALRKEPQERYRTAEQLANDVRAYLAGLPVGARHGTLRYRTSKFAHRHWLGLASAAVLALTLFAGVVGVLWQAKVADEQRRRAEARSADLRQLSNSLLSEFDEAIKELPGSTGAQKLLVTRVLEHLDSMAKDAQGDRQTRLDLVSAYSKLANIQGNDYDQNLGDTPGALVSIDKAIALAAPLAPGGSRDREALRALAFAQQSRSEILFGPGRTQEAIASMRKAVEIYDPMIATTDASTALICDAASAYSVLGDELRESGTASLADTSAVLTAYRKAIALDERALIIDPHFLRALRSLSINRGKIGGVELETDPALALKDYQAALQRIDSLPQAERENLSVRRMRAILQRKEASALVQLGEYAKATDLFTEVAQVFQKNVAADAQDSRALADMKVVLNFEALGYETAADPALAVAGSDRRRNLVAAEKLWTQELEIIDQAIKHDPVDEDMQLSRADALLRLGTIHSILHSAAGYEAMAKKGIAGLKDLARKEQASALVLDMAASDLLMVEPASLRDPLFAVACAERAVSLNHRKTPSMLLTLAQAYRASGQAEKSRATASEALALLPAPQPGSAKPRIRKLLELQLQPGNS
jgi:tetratricopeptide (TPR) repeat protein